MRAARAPLLRAATAGVMKTRLCLTLLATRASNSSLVDLTSAGSFSSLLPSNEGSFTRGTGSVAGHVQMLASVVCKPCPAFCKCVIFLHSTAALQIFSQHLCIAFSV